MRRQTDQRLVRRNANGSQQPNSYREAEFLVPPPQAGAQDHRLRAIRVDRQDVATLDRASEQLKRALRDETERHD
jgi:hypothetical protein